MKIANILHSLKGWGRAALMLLCVAAAPLAHAQQARIPNGLDIGFHWSRHWVDFNNDGREDFCVFRADWNRQMLCYESTPTGLNATPRVFDNLPAMAEHQPWRWVDVNGDGKVDLCRLNEPKQLLAKLSCTLGDAFIQSFSFDIPFALYGGEIEQGSDGMENINDFFLSDVDSDGRADLCYLHLLTSTMKYELRCHRSQGSSFSPTVDSTWTYSGVTAGVRTWPRGFFDFNGDGVPDFCRVENGAHVRCLVGSATGISSAKDYVSIQMPEKQYSDSAGFIDINGDGNTDFCRAMESGGLTRIGCMLASGRGWEDAQSLSSGLDIGVSGSRWWADVNGDGAPDYCRAVGGDPGTGERDVTSTLKCSLGSRAATLLVSGNITVTNVNFGRGDGGRTFCDPFGSGVSTLCRATTSATPIGKQCYEGENGEPLCFDAFDTPGLYVGLQDGLQAQQALMTTFSDGVGAETRVTYLPLTNSRVYKRSGFGTWPRTLLALPTSMVVHETRAWLRDPSVPESQWTPLTGTARYFYKDMTVDVFNGGRGFRQRFMLTEGNNTIDHAIYFQGLGPTVDTSSVLDDPLEFGQAKERRRFAIDTSVVTRSTKPGLNQRQALLEGVMETIAAGKGLGTAPVSPPTATNPFMLLQRTVNTLGSTAKEPGETLPAGTAAVNPRVRFPAASRTQAWDWNNRTAVALPVTDTSVSMNPFGNIWSQQQTTTQQLGGGATMVWKTTTTNEHKQDNATKWILGRMTKSTVVKEAPSADDQIAARTRSAGNSPHAAETSGTQPPAPGLISPAALSAILQLLLDD
jgi:hypothetical protein